VVHPAMESEAQLVARAQNGDRNAYGDLVRSHHRGVIQVIYRMCGDSELAQDAAQEAFLRAWTHLPTYRPGTNLRSWLYRIAVNAALDVLRRESKISNTDFETLTMPDPQAGPESELLKKERTLAVQIAILTLSEASRSVLVLREYGGLTYQEIAAALEIPMGTVMSRLNYARRQLKSALLPHVLQLEIENG